MDDILGAHAVFAGLAQGVSRDTQIAPMHQALNVGKFHLLILRCREVIIAGMNYIPGVNTLQVVQVLKDHPAVLEIGVAAIPHSEGRMVKRRSKRGWSLSPADPRPGES
jgi:hypothetical protein